MKTNRRESALTKSIQAGLLRDSDSFKRTAWGHVRAFFTIGRIKLIRHESTVFSNMRRDVWHFNENQYLESFHSTGGKQALRAIGDLGYSGSVRAASKSCIA